MRLLYFRMKKNGAATLHSMRARISWNRIALLAALAVVCCQFLAFAQTVDLAAESRQAKELMSGGKFDDAIPIYERLVKAVPGNIGLLLNLALAEEMAGRHARAIPHFETVLKAQPNNLAALVTLSMARLQLHQTREALPTLRKAVALAPKDMDALGMLADAEASQNLLEEASKHYRQLTVANEADPRAWYGLGKAYEALATNSFDRLNKLAPQSPYVAVLLADTRLQRRQYRSAFFFYREAQKTLPELPGLHAGLALVYKATEHADWAEAEEKFEERIPPPDCTEQPVACAFLAGNFLDAVMTVPTGATPATLFWLTRAYNQLAGNAFEKLGGLPESVQVHAFKAQTFHDHKQDLEAAEEWRAALKLSPDDAKLKQELASALFDAKDYQGALPLVEEQLRHEANSRELNYLMGASLWRTEQAEKALPYLQAAVRGGSEFLPADAELGLTLVALGKNADAIPYLKKALALDDDGSLHYSLARAYRGAGQTQLADEMMGQYQKIQKLNEQVNQQLAKEAEIGAPTNK